MVISENNKAGKEVRLHDRKFKKRENIINLQVKMT